MVRQVSVFYYVYAHGIVTVASLGLMSPGAATDRCYPILFWEKNPTTFLVIARAKSDDLLAVVSTPLPPSHVSSVLSKFSHKKNKF